VSLDGVLEHCLPARRTQAFEKLVSCVALVQRSV
jgi:hypothetical protein